jgi:hypothetical protein
MLALTLLAGAAQAQQRTDSPGFRLGNKAEVAGILLMLPALVSVPTFGIIDLATVGRSSPLPVWYGHLELWLAGLPTITGAILLVAAGEKTRTPPSFMMLTLGAALSTHGLYTIFRARSPDPPVQVGLAIDDRGNKLLSLSLRY